MAFTIESFFNPHLAPGISRIDSIISVTSCNSVVSSGNNDKKAVVFVLDVSGSMMDKGKIDMGKLALRKCIDLLDENCFFSIITFQSFAEVIVPMTQATSYAKSFAHEKIKTLRASGGTEMSKALKAALYQLSQLKDAIPYVQFVTDGQNAPRDEISLERVLTSCEGKFRCDCWGVGIDWRPDELRKISSCLMGMADAVTEPEKLEMRFKNALKEAMAKGVADVRLRLQLPKTSKIVTVKQMSPEILDLYKFIKKVDERNFDILLGAWGDESRDYHIAFKIESQAEGDEMMACRPKIVYTENGSDVVEDGQRIIATWTGNENLTARINQHVAHYTGQEELANSIQEGLEAKARGDVEQATVLLGKAAKIAVESGNEEVTRRLKKVVDIVDAEHGTVRLRRGGSGIEDKAAELELDMGGTRTVRRRSSLPEGGA